MLRNLWEICGLYLIRAYFSGISVCNCCTTIFFESHNKVVFQVDLFYSAY
jgi:hypothetical protein